MRRLTIFSALALALLLVSIPGWAQQDVITTVIGGGPNGIPATEAPLNQPAGVALDNVGNVYIAAYSDNRVYKVTASTGKISLVAGSGAQNYYGDGVTGGAVNADLDRPYAVAVDSTGNVYIADTYNCVVRKVDSTSTITTVVGTAGQCNSTGTDLNYPEGVAVDGSGNLYISDTNNCAVRKYVPSTKTLSTYAGTLASCGYSGDSGKATSAQMRNVGGIAVDSSGNVFIGDNNNWRIREVVKSSGNIVTVAGTGTSGYSGDGAAATSANITNVYGITTNGSGSSETVTFSDFNNQRVRQFTIGANIATVAGNGTACAGTCGAGGQATSAEVYYPEGVVETSGGTLYLANVDNDVVDTFTVGGLLNVYAGIANSTTEPLLTGVPANGVRLINPFGIAVDATGNIFVADVNHQVVGEDVKASGLYNIYAGNGTYGFLGDGGPATSAEMRYPYGVVKNAAGDVFIADYNNCLIREVLTGTNPNITTYAGLITNGNAGPCGYAGDGGAPLSAELYNPIGVALDKSGNLYIADYSNHVVRKVANGILTTIAGIGGVAGYSGDGGPATNALLNNPDALAVDPAGNVFIADRGNCRIREINAMTGVISTIGGTGVCGFGGDGLATSNPIAYPQGIAVDANDNVFVGDYYYRIRWIAPNGFMTTIAGQNANGFDGDGGLATSAVLSQPTGVALDSAGNVLFGDWNNARVRRITAFSSLSTSTSSLSYGLTSVGSTSSPESFTVSAYGPVTISNISTSANFTEADNCPSSLANGNTCTMYVYFVPTASGTLNGNVTINNNGFFSQTNTVNLTGLGSAIALSGSPAAFGNVLVKTTSPAKTVTVTNSGTNAITMGAITSTNTTDYTVTKNTCPASGATLAAGASCAITITFTPQSTGAKRGTVVVNDSDPSSPQLIGLSGTGTSNVSLTPNSITFATTPVGIVSKVTAITLTNKTGVSITLAATPITVTGPFVNVATTTCTADLVIAAGGTCVINVQFKPTAVGYAQGSISVADSDVTSPQSVVLQGYGTGIKFTPATVQFGTVNRGTRVSSTVTITNVGKTNVFFTGAELSGPNSADFADNYNDAAPCNFTSTNQMPPGGTCQLTVYFDPSKVGGESATYKVFDNSVGSPQTLPMAGTGQ